jgi:AcrR family transcriptional regulator
MSRLPGDTRKTITDLGERLLLNQGFNGFSYADIATSLGIKNAAVHYHFPTKCDLGVEIIRCARQRFDRWGVSRKTQDMPERERLDAFFAIYRYYLTKGGSVCLSGALETDYTTLPAPMQEEAKGLVEDLLAWLEKFLEEGRREKTFVFPGTPRDQAIVVLTVMQGALQMTRVMDKSVFDSAVEQIRRLLTP